MNRGAPSRKTQNRTSLLRLGSRGLWIAAFVVSLGLGFTGLGCAHDKKQVLALWNTPTPLARVRSGQPTHDHRVRAARGQGMSGGFGAAPLPRSRTRQRSQTARAPRAKAASPDGPGSCLAAPLKTRAAWRQRVVFFRASRVNNALMLFPTKSAALFFAAPL